MRPASIAARALFPVMVRNEALKCKRMVAWPNAPCAFLSASLNWTGYSDCGFDVLWAGARIDVKWTGQRGRCLIWPINKKHIFDQEPFSVLVLVRGDCPRFTIAGFVSKTMFGRCKHEADGSNGLDRGTWFMHQAELADPELFWGIGTLLNLRARKN
jgi:hypothetical protein